ITTDTNMELPHSPPTKIFISTPPSLPPSNTFNVDIPEANFKQAFGPNTDLSYWSAIPVDMVGPNYCGLPFFMLLQSRERKERKTLSDLKAGNTFIMNVNKPGVWKIHPEVRV